MRTYSRTGVTRFVLGRKLYQLENGFWEDDTKTRFDLYRNERLYKETAKGVWLEIKTSEPAPLFEAADRRYGGDR